MQPVRTRKGLHPLVYQLYRLAKSSRTAVRPSSGEILSMLDAATTAVKDSFTPDDLSVLAWSVGRIGHASPSFWRVAANLAEVYSQDFTPRATARLLEGFASAGDRRVSQTAVTALLEHFRDPPREPITDQGVCQLLRALVKLKRTEEIPAWMVQQGLHHLEGSTEEGVSSRSLVPLMWPLSRIPSAADKATSIVAMLIRGGRLDYTQMTTTNVALLIHALGNAWDTSLEKDGDGPPPYRDVLSQLVTECGVRGWKGLSPHAIAGVLWACGRCTVTSLLEECSDDWHPLMEVELRDFDPQALANVLWGIGRINRKQLPSWLPPSTIEAALLHQGSKADLFSLSMMACALAYEENFDVDSLFDALWRSVRGLIHRRAHGSNTGDLAALLWAFSRRGHSEAAKDLAAVCEHHLRSLSTNLRAMALWGMANAGHLLPSHIGRDVLTCIQEETISSSTVTSLVAVGRMCPTLSLPLPSPLHSVAATDLWQLTLVRNVPIAQRRTALSLAMRLRSNTPTTAAAYYAGCLDPEWGFLYPSRTRLSVLRDRVRSGLAKCPSRYLPVLACHLVVGEERRSKLNFVVDGAASPSGSPAPECGQNLRGARQKDARSKSPVQWFSAEGLSKVAWAAARSKHRDGDFFAQLDRLTTENASAFSPRNAALFLESVAMDESPWSSGSIETVVQHLSRGADRSDPRDVCQILRALVKLRKAEKAPAWAITAALQTIQTGPSRAALEPCVYEACVEELCWSLARMRRRRAPLCEAIAQAINGERLVLANLTPSRLASLLQSMGLAWAPSDPGHSLASAYRAAMARLVSHCEAGAWAGVTAPAMSGVVWACARVGVDRLTDITIGVSHPLMAMDFSILNAKSMLRLVRAALKLHDGKLPIWLSLDKLAPGLREAVAFMSLNDLSCLTGALPSSAGATSSGTAELVAAMWKRTAAVVRELGNGTPRKAKVEAMALLIRFTRHAPLQEVAAVAEHVARLDERSGLPPEQRLLVALGRMKAAHLLPDALVDAALQSLEVGSADPLWVLEVCIALSSGKRRCREASKLLLTILRQGRLDLRQVTTATLSDFFAALVEHPSGALKEGPASTGRTGLPPYSPIMETLVDECYRRGWQGFSPGQISRILWACGKGSIDSIIVNATPSLNPLGQVSLDDFEGAELANALWAIHKLTGNTLPPWCTIEKTSVSCAVRTMNLHDLGVLAFALARVEGSTADGVFDGVWQRLNGILTDSTAAAGRVDAANLASIMWSFAWRDRLDEVQEMSSWVTDALPQLPAETQGLALWALAKAKLRLSVYSAKSIRQSLLSRPITRHTANALVNLWVLRPSQRVVFPVPLNDYPPGDLWKLVGITAATPMQRREALSLALRNRGASFPSAAAHYAGCLTVDEGFLQGSRLRLNILRGLACFHQTSPKYLSKFACHLSDLA
ncbi:hypothetical protein FOZ61_007627 [Perkinsus olseni]|uniref:Uncharacterized protein n=1 Tax=Perkinsus olseni TaxID=32597 RepID=A0A7J6L834_PEROL|nr:hypothetical protein FOZ61_007627 [Perkinsus olseni]